MKIILNRLTNMKILDIWINQLVSNDFLLELGKRDVILPIFWSEESVGEIEDAETLALLHKGVHAPQQATTGL